MQVVGFAYNPSYYGLHDALSLHNLWEQETNPVVVTPRRVRPGLRTFLGQNYLVKTIPRNLFFGFQTLRYHDLWIRVSDPEKTLIDFVYYRQPLPPEALEELKTRIRKPLLQEYLQQTPPRVRKRVTRLLQKLL